MTEPTENALKRHAYAAYRRQWRLDNPPFSVAGEDGMGIRAPAEKQPEQSLEVSGKSL